MNGSVFICKVSRDPHKVVCIRADSHLTLKLTLTQLITLKYSIMLNKQSIKKNLLNHLRSALLIMTVSKIESLSA